MHVCWKTLFSDVDVDLHDDVDDDDDDDDVHRPRFSPALTDSRQKVIKSYKVSHYLPLFTFSQRWTWLVQQQLMDLWRLLMPLMLVLPVSAFMSKLFKLFHLDRIAENPSIVSFLKPKYKRATLPEQSVSNL